MSRTIAEQLEALDLVSHARVREVQDDVRRQRDRRARDQDAHRAEAKRLRDFKLEVRLSARAEEVSMADRVDQFYAAKKKAVGR